MQVFGARNIIETWSGRDALGIIQAKPVDFALMEWMLPDTSGIDLIRSIRALRTDARYTPCIMVTSETRVSQVYTARNVGVSEYVAKPFTAKSVFLRVREVVERPRPFVQVKGYFGPDRRRRTEALENGDDRRGAADVKREKSTAHASDAALSQDQIDKIIAGDSIKDIIVPNAPKKKL